MNTWHKIIFGDCRDMREVEDGSVNLIVTSPPYFNAPFDFPNLFRDYDEFLQLLRDLAKEAYRILADGRIACLVTDDMLVDGVKYPIVADLTKIFLDAGFHYRDKIIWRKPEGYVRISRRSGVAVQKPYPMYFYPDNIKEEILIFQKGEFDYSQVSRDMKKLSHLDTTEFLDYKWYLSVWDVTNVLPSEGFQYLAPFPEEIVSRLIKLFSFVGDTVLDPFLGSGTTTKLAKDMGRNSIGYEIDLELAPIIKQRLEYSETEPRLDTSIQVITRQDAQHLRVALNTEIQKKINPTRRKQLIAGLNPHDRVVLAMTKVLTCYGFKTSYNIKGARTKLIGNSGSNYFIDVVGEKGLLTVLCDVRTRGQRGTQAKTDRGAVQMLQAVIDDFTVSLHRPRGLIVNPNGAVDDAVNIGKHFGIAVITLPMEAVEIILRLNEKKDHQQILAEAQKYGIIL